IRVIEEVVRLSAELHLVTFGNREPLYQRSVCFEESGIMEDIASRRPDLEGVRVCESCGFLRREEIHSVSPALNTADVAVRTTVIGVRAGGRIAANRDSQALRENREWLPRRRNLQNTDLPVPDSGVEPTWHAAAEPLASAKWNCIESTQIKRVRTVEIAACPVQTEI